MARELPVVSGVCREKLAAAIRELDPEVVVALGQAGGRAEITPERVAINVDDYRITDNAGEQPADVPVVAGGSVAYWSSLPVKAIVNAMLDAGVPAKVSNSAGTFVCNHLFYGLMHELAAEGEKRTGGFIHVPCLPEQAARLNSQPSMALETIVRGLEAAIGALFARDSTPTSTPPASRVTTVSSQYFGACWSGSSRSTRRPAVLREESPPLYREVSHAGLGATAHENVIARRAIARRSNLSHATGIASGLRPLAMTQERPFSGQILTTVPHE